MLQPEKTDAALISQTDVVRIRDYVSQYCKNNPAADAWAAGCGVIEHTMETQARIFQLAEHLTAWGMKGDGVAFFDLLTAADIVANAAMWLVVHQTYAHSVYLDGRDLKADDFKASPQGHTGGSLNMVPAYVGYMTVNAITGFTRSWVMGQGHCVSAIDSTNLILDNMTEVHTARYALSDEGLTRYVRDFYSYEIGDDGEPTSPLGSHVNVNTAGGLVEGGYLGFTELQYEHMPLQGERLVAFLSDGAFEEQRGSDWAARWWRSEDCGLVTPIMISNGRRIDQRSTMAQEGGTEWFEQHLRLNGFDPIIFDGRDPAAFVWAIYEMEERLQAGAKAAAEQTGYDNILMPYGIAVAPKGAGFYNAGTNLAHNLPLGNNPHTNQMAARHFNESGRKLWVPLDELQKAIGMLQHHAISDRPRERDHALAHRDVRLDQVVQPLRHNIAEDRSPMTNWTRSSPMDAVDHMFLNICEANTHLRPRVGNPDEMSSNRMQNTLDALKFRVTAPEAGLPESLHGVVVTALNEEAVVCAAIGNKGGINLIVTYEAFGIKMHGAIRQEITFTDHSNRGGRKQGWLSLPLVLTSHTWENGKNEQSHQDPVMAETMLGEVSNVSRVLFPADYNTASQAMSAVYQTQGQIWTMVIPKADCVADLFTAAEARLLLEQGALRLDWAGYDVANQQLVLTAVGAYQLEEALKASHRLTETKIPHSLVYMIEPGRFRDPRTTHEAEVMAAPELRDDLYPESANTRIFITHTRPEPLLGVLQPLNTGKQTVALGYRSHGGTLDTPGMLFINGSTWAHILLKAAHLLGLSDERLLTHAELAALGGQANPVGVIIRTPYQPLAQEGER